MRIVIVGPGAMGCLFAGLLAESGQHDVWLLDKSESRADQISENGLKIEGIGGFRLIRSVKATSDPHRIGRADLVLICVKSYDTAEASMSILPAVGDNTTILTLQNGLTNVETISQILGPDKVIAGVTSHGATMLGIGYIRHAGVGDTTIGEVGIDRRSDQRIKFVAGLLESAGFKTSISDNIYNSIWAKLIINASINPLTAITRLRNGELLEHDQVRKLLGMIARESADVAIAQGISLPYNEPISAVEEVCRATASNVSSMLQDILRQKRTEIDAINGAIVDRARELGLKATINEILTYLVKGIEQGQRDSNVDKK